MLNSLKKINFIKDEKGVSLVEVIVIIVIVSIAVTPLSRLAVTNLKSGGHFSIMTRAISYAQNTMEEVVADYAAEDGGRGYAWVQANWDGVSSSPESGFTSTVNISNEDTLNQVAYVEVDVYVSAPEINTVSLSTWLINPN